MGSTTNRQLFAMLLSVVTSGVVAAETEHIGWGLAAGLALLTMIYAVPERAG